jgi:CBS domain-containing protein
MKTCSDAMTREPICCLPSDSVNHVAQLMKREKVSAVPVVASYATNKLVGMVTDRDLALKVVAEGRDSRQTNIEAVMTPEPWTCSPDDSLQRAFTIMAHQQVPRVPIVDDSGKVVGLIDVAAQTDAPPPMFRIANRTPRSVGYPAVD